MFTFRNIGYSIYSMKREILFYERTDGVCPVQEFLDSLQPDVLKKVFFVFDLVEEFDIVPVKFFKKLQNTDNIWEIRVKNKSDIYRLFGFMEKNKLIILTNGYQKKSQKIDKNEISLAEKLKNDYLKRKVEK